MIIDTHLVFWVEAAMVATAAVFFILNSAFTAVLYRRLGGAGWHAWIPIYGNARLLTTAGMSAWWSLLGAFFIWDAIESYISVADTLNLLATQTPEQLMTMANSRDIITTSMLENISSAVGSIGALVFSIVLWIAVYRVAKGFGYSPNGMVTVWALLQPVYFAVLAFGRREFDVARMKARKHAVVVDEPVLAA
ncbi:MAG: hypothetical protein RL243_91 [Actinomycetota bacterium]|jgi:hypothetical protein